MADEAARAADRAWVSRGAAAIQAAEHGTEAARAEAKPPNDNAAAGKPVEVATTPPNETKPQPPQSSVRERIAARDERRREVEQYRLQAAQIEAYAREHLVPGAQSYAAIKAAHARGDFPEVARLLGAETWEQVNEHYVRTLSDPGHTKVLELERKLAEREQREQWEARQRQEHAQAQMQQRALAEYRATLSAKMKASTDPVLADFHGEAHVIDAVFGAIARHYQNTGEELSLEEALDAKQPNGMSIREGLDSYESFADRYRASKAKRAPAATPQPKAKPTTARSTGSSDRDWLARSEERMREAFREEEKRRAAR